MAKDTKTNGIRYISLVALLSTGLITGLGGCGIKPDSVEPPAGAEDTKFPRTYPAQD